MAHLKSISIAFLSIASSLLLHQSTALPQTKVLPAPSSDLTWPAKFSTFRAHILTLRSPQPALHARAGPSLQLNFASPSPFPSSPTCLEVRLLNWDCTYDVPISMAAVAAWLDSTGFATENPIWDDYRFYYAGDYVDPVDGWGFRGEVKLVFGACGNRGVQSACGVRYCTDREGNEVQGEDVPVGKEMGLDPNDRNGVCEWLRDGNGTVVG